MRKPFSLAPAGYTPPVPRRAIVGFVLAAALLAWPVGSGATAERIPAGHNGANQGNGTVTLRVRTRLGPWKKALYLKLVKTRLSGFSVCGIRNWDPAEKFECDSAGGRLPEGTNLRVEQSPIGKALRRADSPGWGMLGTAATARVGASLSNVLTGDKFGKFRYRVTLRGAAGQVLATSNIVSVTWHK
jgi:hypothetical protein